MSKIVITARSATSIIDMINVYQDKGYNIENIWYERGWFLTYYYAKLVKRQQPQPLPNIEFIIGPILTRNLPKPPKPPRLEFVVGPINIK